MVLYFKHLEERDIKDLGGPNLGVTRQTDGRHQADRRVSPGRQTGVTRQTDGRHQADRRASPGRQTGVTRQTDGRHQTDRRVSPGRQTGVTRQTDGRHQADRRASPDRQTGVTRQTDGCHQADRRASPGRQTGVTRQTDGRHQTDRRVFSTCVPGQGNVGKQLELKLRKKLRSIDRGSIMDVNAVVRRSATRGTARSQGRAGPLASGLWPQACSPAPHVDSVITVVRKQ
ncbi:hypothetical protein NHX12_029942 [Muraenolepis orangiensis]|uniref:Uncharacterized protein n=1 Tax=Muraenolepis orangiensis TaxID=630683 RepID=A0A9Q0E981_9TELE|nr:hypothetical protein NHX12_029942 [Muraenolepis orangiensis]